MKVKGPWGDGQPDEQLAEKPAGQSAGQFAGEYPTASPKQSSEQLLEQSGARPPQRLPLQITWSNRWKEFGLGLFELFTYRPIRSSAVCDVFGDVGVRRSRPFLGVLTSLGLHVAIVYLLLVGSLVELLSSPSAPMVVRLTVDQAWSSGPLWLPTVAPRLPNNRPGMRAKQTIAEPSITESIPKMVAEVEAPPVILVMPERVNHPTQNVEVDLPDVNVRIKAIDVALPNLFLPNAVLAPPVAPSVDPLDSQRTRLSMPDVEAVPVPAPVEDSFQPVALASVENPLLTPALPVPVRPLDTDLTSVRFQVEASIADETVGASPQAFEGSPFEDVNTDGDFSDIPVGGVIAISAQPALPTTVLEIPKTRLRAAVAAGPWVGQQVLAEAGLSDQEGSMTTPPGFEDDEDSEGDVSVGAIPAVDLVVPGLLVMGGPAPPSPESLSSESPAPFVDGVGRGAVAGEGRGMGKEIARRPGLLSSRRNALVQDIQKDTQPVQQTLGTSQERGKQLLQEAVPSKSYRRRVYTTLINMPNLTSRSGSWVLRFAEMGKVGVPVGGGASDASALEAPVALRKVDPRYPAEAKRERVEGTVYLYGIIRPDGLVEEIAVVQGVDSVLDANAVEAFRRWRFRPGRKNGQPISLEVVIEVPFRLSRAL